jgi:hypothetical protein
MMSDYLRWASGPDELQRLGAVVAQAMVRLACLRDVPEDAPLRVELVRFVGAIVGHADREGWEALGGVAGPMVRLLATRRGDSPALDALESGLGEIAALIDERMATA